MKTPRAATLGALWLAFGLAYPSLLTWVYYDLLQAAPAVWQQIVYGTGKGIQLLLPILFLVRARRGAAASDDAPDVTGAYRMAATAFGLAVAAGIVLLATVYCPLPETRDGLALRLSTRLAGFGIGGPWSLAMVGLFYSLLHSLFEEYYWRAFVYRGLRDRLSRGMAAVISGVGFAAHHAILLAVLLGGFSSAVWLLTAGVAIGGVFWAWLYQRTGRLRWPWISHALVDAGIFAAAGLMLFGG